MCLQGSVQTVTVTNPPEYYNFWVTLAGQLILFLVIPLVVMITVLTIFGLCVVYNKKTTKVE